MLGNMSQCIRLAIPKLLATLGLLLGLGFSGCTSEQYLPTWKPGDLVRTTIDEVPLQLEIAVTRPQKAKGLMHRKSMPEHQGMLFIFDKPDEQSFWMKNTYIPLDIAYIDPSGTIREIHPLFPHNLNSVRSVSSEIQFALEMNRGWFNENNLKIGSKIDLAPFQSIFKQYKISVSPAR